MAEKEKLQEIIKYRVEWIRLFWITLVAVGSGEVNLLLGGLPALAQKGRPSWAGLLTRSWCDCGSS